ncbi:hypothetical protein [Thermotoga neapolitana]|uniref:Uncharacterized protein n=1 Tax=Thermotoga neapolitana (strain ATCC 49049 / DSM 4359 / NBRC 107923 / NS-E) TaxID=309803 RepID=B9K9J5_THENN|nr:hypothetical protein [Thermotoga neapolitana]ACM23628.1 Putative uncharacterized protein precursor [Thermotoga neapolitana DSM 4359]KFZ21250.1 hypothetical protein LA10_07694 [Thermotoga neapolitana LA10]
MRRLLLIMLALIVSSLFFAQQEVTVYTYGDSDPNNARALISEGMSGNCNRHQWEIPMTLEVQVAQWVKWHLTGTKWTWFVRKPGTYVANCITAELHSNSDLEITFSGFDHLKYATGTSVNDTIEVEYAFGPQLPIPEEVWTPAPDLNNVTLLVPDSQILHDGATYKLWNRIHVVRCNSASTYRDTGTITLTLKNQKPWIDEEGNYVEDLENYVNSER